MSMATAGPNRRRHPLPGASATLTVHGVGDPRRAEVEDFIRRVYAARFGAQVPAFAPDLVCVREGGSIVAAAGYRAAADGPLFLESYLPKPVDRLLSQRSGHPVERRRIVEVGHLASTRPGQGRRLILLLGPLLANQGFQWFVSTLTEGLCRLLLRIGVAPLSLGAADPARLGAQAQHWGTYYEHRPVVIAGRLRQALGQLRRNACATGPAA